MAENATPLGGILPPARAPEKQRFCGVSGGGQKNLVPAAARCYGETCKCRRMPPKKPPPPANCANKVCGADLLAFTRQWQAENPAASKAFFYAAVALAATGKFGAAEASYQRALALDPADFKAWNNLAALLFERLHRPPDAVKCFAEALRLNPANPLGWSNLASLNGQLGRHAQALACAERALALDPQMVEAHLHRARAAQALGRPEILRAASEALAKLPPEKFRRAR